MTISDLNPIQFFTIEPTAIADVTSVTEVIDLAALAATFNTKDRNGAAQDRIYFHVVKSTDVLKSFIIVDDAGHTYKLSGRYEDGTLWQNFDFVQIDDVYFSVSVNLADYPAIVGRKVFFAIIDTTDSEIYAVSDHHSVKTTVTKSILITYSHDGFYADVLADTEFSFRVPGMFDEDAGGQLPEEVESESLSDGSVITLTGSVKEQRRLQVLLVPLYVHKKLKKLLKCSSVEIDGLSWKQEEPYEMAEPPYETFPMRRGSGLLTLDGSIVRSIYST
jgi:hypothetical protein